MQTLLTCLSLRVRALGASGAFLPPSLRRLRVGGPGCGPAWVRAVGVCGALEELDLCDLAPGDLGGCAAGSIIGQLWPHDALAPLITAANQHPTAICI